MGIVWLFNLKNNTNIKVKKINSKFGINFSKISPLISLIEVLIIEEIELFKEKVGIIVSMPNNNKLTFIFKKFWSDNLIKKKTRNIKIK